VFLLSLSLSPLFSLSFCMCACVFVSVCVCVWLSLLHIQIYTRKHKYFVLPAFRRPFFSVSVSVYAALSHIFINFMPPKCAPLIINAQFIFAFMPSSNVVVIVTAADVVVVLVACR